MSDDQLPWKIARDAFYAPLYQTLGGLDGLLEAGYFPDSCPYDAPLDDVHWLTTPLGHIRHSLIDAPPQKPWVVLLSTGAFGPPHIGHLAMMERAKARALEAGWHVLGGFLSPGHDEYMRLKCGDEALPASTRVQLCAQATQGLAWLSVDPWEALHRASSVNFTDVIIRLERYLNHHLRPAQPLQVAYVCGSDNARFALSFIHQGRIIIVERGGAPTKARYLEHPALNANPRILYAAGDSDASSTKLRAGAYELLPPTIPPQALHIKPLRRLYLRCEGADFAPSHLDADTWHLAKHRIAALLAAASDATLHPLEAASQRLPSSDLPIISLDPLLPATHQLGLSRLFELGGYQQRGHTHRPGSPTLQDQLKAIPPGRYDLFDDDASSGQTLRYARALLEQRADIALRHDLTLHACAPDEDLADCRDFILGAREGGLTIITPSGEVGRAPYMLPYVDPSARCGVPPHLALQTSLQLWQLNATLTQGCAATISGLSPAQAAPFLAAGFEPGLSLHALCLAHIAHLRALEPK